MTPAEPEGGRPDTGDEPGNEIAEYLFAAERTGVPISAVLSGPAYLRHLERLRRRAAAMLPLFEDGPPDTSPPDDEDDDDEPKPPLPDNRPWDALRVLGCAGCGRVLLAESEEPLRSAAARPAHGRKPPPPLPPPVAARAAGRPYCADCLDRPVRRVGA